jgi:hypothetical protein
VRCVRRFWDEEGIWFYFELDDDGWVTRQVELQGTARTPIAAASLSEWFTGLNAGRLQRYQARFGVVAEQPIPADEIDHYERGCVRAAVADGAQTPGGVRRPDRYQQLA